MGVIKEGRQRLIGTRFVEGRLNRKREGRRGKLKEREKHERRVYSRRGKARYRWREKDAKERAVCSRRGKASYRWKEAKREDNILKRRGTDGEGTMRKRGQYTEGKS